MPGPTITDLLQPHSHDAFYRVARGWHRELIQRVGALAVEADVGLVICARWLAPHGGTFEAELIDIRSACTELVNDLRQSQIRCKDSEDFAPYDDAMWDSLVEEVSATITERIGHMQGWIDELSVPDLSSVTAMPDERQHELRSMPATLMAHLDALKQCLDPSYIDDWLADNPPA